MWRRPTESGISFICILAPTRFFVKSIKINIARRGLKISSPTSSSSPLSSFWQAKNSLLFLPHRLRQTRLLEKKCTPRAENSFARKLLQPAFEFLEGQKLASISSSQAQANQVLEKKMHPAGRIFQIFKKLYFYLNKLSTF